MFRSSHYNANVFFTSPKLVAEDIITQQKFMEVPIKYPAKLTLRVVLTCIMAATGGLIFGYDHGVSGKSNLQHLLKNSCFDAKSFSNFPFWPCLNLETRFDIWVFIALLSGELCVKDGGFGFLKTVLILVRGDIRCVEWLREKGRGKRLSVRFLLLTN